MAGEGVLSVEAALSQKMIKGAWTLTRLLYLLDSLTRYDLDVEKKRKNAGWTSGLALAGSVLFLIGFAITEWSFMGVIAAIALLTGLVYFFIYRSRDKKDVPNDFRLYLVPLLRMLSGDIKAKSKVAIRMDIAKIQDKKYSRGSVDIPPSAPYYKITAERFERDLMTVSILLNDGNRLIIKQRECLVVITKKKKTPRGKYKTKMKYKRTVISKVRLLVTPKSYRALKPGHAGTAAQAVFKRKGRKGALELKAVEKGDGEMVSNTGLTLNQIAALYSRLVRVEKGEGGKKAV